MQRLEFRSCVSLRAGAFENLVHHLQQCGRRVGFRKDMIYTEAGELRRVGGRGESAGPDDGQLRIQAAQNTDEFRTFHYRHRHIRDHRGDFYGCDAAAEWMDYGF